MSTWANAPVRCFIAALLLDFPEAQHQNKQSQRRHDPSRVASNVASMGALAGTYLRKCEKDKAAFEAFGQKCAAEQKKTAEKHNSIAQQHNRIVQEYNELLHSHKALIDKFNNLLEDPSTAGFLAAKASKLSRHPGIQGAVNKTMVKVLPVAHYALFEAQNHSKAAVQQWLLAHGNKIIPEGWLPSVSGFVVYGSVLIPSCIACCCVLMAKDNKLSQIIGNVCYLRPLLMFGHVYLAVFGGCCAAFAIWTGEDPLLIFASHASELYQFAQVAFAMMIICYTLASIVALPCIAGGKLFRCVQLVVTISFLVTYYFLVWTPAMLDESPEIQGLFTQQVDGPLSEKHETTFVAVALPYVGVFFVFSVFGACESRGLSSSVVDPESHKDCKEA